MSEKSGSETVIPSYPSTVLTWTELSDLLLSLKMRSFCIDKDGNIKSNDVSSEKTYLHFESENGCLTVQVSSKQINYNKKVFTKLNF